MILWLSRNRFLFAHVEDSRSAVVYKVENFWDSFRTAHNAGSVDVWVCWLFILGWVGLIGATLWLCVLFFKNCHGLILAIAVLAVGATAAVSITAGHFSFSFGD